jgi:hypothetical protein
MSTSKSGSRSETCGKRGGAAQGVQGATVLHRLARLYKIAIQGATQGATKCNTGCYKSKEFKSSA